MPFCDVGKYQKGKENNGVKIFYRRYGHGSTKVLLIIGLAGTHDSWGPQVKGLTGSHEPNDDVDGTVAVDRGVDGGDDEEGQGGEGFEVCCFDNRGMGRSSVPTRKSEYTTMSMARDALALLDHLGWKKAHVFGHSMGAMIACKLAALAPERLSSLALLNATGGGFECFPKLDRKTLSVAIRFLRAKTPEERADVDLDTHYTKEYLDEYVGSCTRRSILYQEYVKGITSTGMQSSYGFEGQVNACWTHKLTSKELETIRTSGFFVSVIHGRYDIIAQVSHGRRLAEKLRPVSRMIEMHGGHLVSHERPVEVNAALTELIRSSESNVSLQEWSSLPINRTEILSSGLSISSSEVDIEQESSLAYIYDALAKIRLSFLYFVGLFVMGFKHMKVAFKKARVEPSHS
ncbi:hypothetical protein QJS04_geneDACA022488 [Acorus gramineus]|uniref:AB hydrolase-1 domain-containing protein n=1 Tax=Acorus gramineus TaxID=55184 RepID=A0AAV9BHT6_ACOGR|nr:hypothetical protein QJS04_geneDACA022488 [Acorus gramineus]